MSNTAAVIRPWRPASQDRSAAFANGLAVGRAPADRPRVPPPPAPADRPRAPAPAPGGRACAIAAPAPNAATPWISTSRPSRALRDIGMLRDHRTRAAQDGGDRVVDQT